jgi:hypothetical protein
MRWSTTVYRVTRVRVSWRDVVAIANCNVLPTFTWNFRLVPPKNIICSSFGPNYIWINWFDLVLDLSGEEQSEGLPVWLRRWMVRARWHCTKKARPQEAYLQWIKKLNYVYSMCCTGTGNGVLCWAWCATKKHFLSTDWKPLWISSVNSCIVKVVRIKTSGHTDSWKSRCTLAF